MVKFKFFKILLLGVCFLYFVSCGKRNSERPNGWYYIVEGSADSISKEPIVTVNDFAELKLDSGMNTQTGEMIYQITGKVNERSVKKYVDATEKSIGKRIGFVYNDVVVSDPRVNARIESGRFSISTNKKYDIKSLYYQIEEDIN